jgi:hypothetical protein
MLESNLILEKRILIEFQERIHSKFYFYFLDCKISNIIHI